MFFFNLNSDLNNEMDWFKINFLEANSGRFHIMVLGANINDCLNLNVAHKVMPSSSEVKLLGITVDNELKFKKQINEFCRNVPQRIRRYLPFDKSRLLSNAFIDSQLNYVPLIWMFAGKPLINKICKIHHRTLQVVCNYFNKLYDELLRLNNNLSIYLRY